MLAPTSLTLRRQFELLEQCAVFGLNLRVFGGDDYGGGYFVVGVEVEELDAGGGAAGGADERNI
jgi:hypothetical protein